jgi:hypothetical protein
MKNKNVFASMVLHGMIIVVGYIALIIGAI